MDEPDMHIMKQEKDIKGLIKALNYKPDWHIVAEAALALADFGEKSAVEPIIRTLESNDDSRCRFRLIHALEMLKDKRATEPLIDVLESTYEGSGNRQLAARALGKIKDTRAVEPLITALNDENEHVRSAAAYSLGDIKDARAVKPLLNSLKDKEATVRYSSAVSLGKLRDIRASKHLVKRLKDEDREVREAALEALNEIGDTKTLEALTKKLKKTPEKIVDDNAIELYIQLLQSKDRPTLLMNPPELSAEILGEIGDERATEALINALLCGNESVQAKAAEALGKIGDDKCRRIFSKFITTRVYYRGSSEISRSPWENRRSKSNGTPRLGASQ